MQLKIGYLFQCLPRASPWVHQQSALRPEGAKALKKIRILRMKTREEYIALIASHAEELQNTFGITSLRLFGVVGELFF